MTMRAAATATAVQVLMLVLPVAQPLSMPSAAVALRGRVARAAAFRSFSADTDLSKAEMQVIHGKVPAWLHGAYLRNGPGLFEAGERRLKHWFDGYGFLVRVQLDGADRPPQLSTRFIASDAYAAVQAGEMGYAEFMTPLVAPGGGPFGALRGLLALAAGDPTDNACVNVVQHGGSLIAMTETHRSWVRVDPASLETGERVCWTGARIGLLATAHPRPDPMGDGGMINVATDISPPFSSTYQV